jgi:hypothetical protein
MRACHAFAIVLIVLSSLQCHPFTLANPSLPFHQPFAASLSEVLGINVHLTFAPPLLSRVIAANANFSNESIRFPRPHIPHVTLYLSKFPESSLPHLLDAIREAAKTPAFTMPCVSNLSSAAVIGNYSMLQVAISSCLQYMSDMVVERTHHLALPNQTAPQWLLMLPEPLRSMKMDMLSRFGSPSVFAQFDPHITLACSASSAEVVLAIRALDGIRSPFIPLQLQVSRSGVCGTVLSEQTMLSIDLSPLSNSTGNVSSNEAQMPTPSKFGLRVILTSFLSALFAGGIAALATFVVEKLGGVKGGILAATPTTILPALIGMKSNAFSHDDFAASVWLLPVGALCNSIFLATWRYGPPRLPHRWTLRRKYVKTLSTHKFFNLF